MSEQVRRRFAAEVIFTNPGDVPDVRAILAEADCELEIDHDCIDEYTNYQWAMITGTTETPTGATVRRIPTAPGLCDCPEREPSATHQCRPPRVSDLLKQGA